MDSNSLLAIVQVFLDPDNCSTGACLCLQGLRLSLARMRLAKDKAEATVSELESNLQMHKAAAAALKQVRADAKRTRMLLGAFVRSSAAIHLRPAWGEAVQRHANVPHVLLDKCHPGLPLPCRHALPDMHIPACRLPALNQRPASCKPILLRRSTPSASCAQRWTCSRQNTAR